MKKSVLSLAAVFVLAACLSGCNGVKKENVQESDYFLNYETNYDSSKPVLVIGHMNPDSDTVCSAVAYADFLNKMGFSAKAVLAGKANAESTYALKKFEVEMPEVVENAEGNQFAIMDHSLFEQSIPGMKNAEILAVLDHHAVGDVTTKNPVLYIGMPVGSTSTIVYEQFKRYGVKVSKQAAGMMLSAILSDTLGLRSPITTSFDRKNVEELMPIAEVKDYLAYTDELLEAGNVYSSLSIEEILKYDYKKFGADKASFSVGVVQSANEKQLIEIEGQLNEYMKLNFDSLGVDMNFMMKVDLVKMETKLLCYGNNSLETAKKAFGVDSDVILLKDTVSRKKQIIPPLTQALSN